MFQLPALFDADAFRAVPHLEFCDRVDVIQDEPFIDAVQGINPELIF